MIMNNHHTNYNLSLSYNCTLYHNFWEFPSMTRHCRASWVAGKVLTILETCIMRTFKVPVPKCLSNGVPPDGILTPYLVHLESLAVDKARVQEIPVGLRANEDRADLRVEDLLIVSQGGLSFFGAVWGHAGLVVAGAQNNRIVLRVQDKQWSLDEAVDVLDMRGKVCLVDRTLSWWKLKCQNLS